MAPQPNKDNLGTSTSNGKGGKPKKNYKYPLWKNVLAMVLLFAAVIAAAYFLTIQYTRHGEEVAVPDLRGLTVQQAFDRLEALGLEGDIRDSVYSKDLGPGLVWGQSISANSRVKVGRLIALTINTYDTPTINLPDIAENSSYNEAAALLKSMGFTLTAPQTIDGIKDWVYAVKYKGRNVAPGTRIRVNDPITLVVGNGRMTEEIDSFRNNPEPANYDEEIIEIL